MPEAQIARDTKKEPPAMTRRTKRRRARAQRSLPAENRAKLESEIREAYFAIASWVALRYAVEVDDVIRHLRNAGVHEMPRTRSVVQYVEDIVLAVAATQGNLQAWTDMAQVFELTLLRTCALRLPDEEAVLYVRRFVLELERETMAPETELSAQSLSWSARTSDGETFDDDPAEGDGGLRAYAGRRPLRVWLTDRLLVKLEQDAPNMRVQLDSAHLNGLPALRLAD
jgi:hypothetical protein